METSATWARRAIHYGNHARKLEALVPSSSQLDRAHPRQVQNPTRHIWGSRGFTQKGAKGERLTGQASMVEYIRNAHHHHVWDYKLESNHPEPPLLTTHDQLANIHDPIT